MSRDVLLLLEGTYPYVRGGVSGWVHQLINGLPELRFRLIFIGGNREHYAGMQYALPDNVVQLDEYYLEDAWRVVRGRPRPGNDAAFQHAEQLHAAARGDAAAEDSDWRRQSAASRQLNSQRSTQPNTQALDELLGLVTEEGAALRRNEFMFSKASWRSITRSYEQRCTSPSFLNYFWTVRSMHAPIFLLADIARAAPRNCLIHSVSTGYAGMLGAMIKRRQPGATYVLTEHGIYTKERKIDLSQADWIIEQTSSLDVGLTDDVGYIRKLWIRFYEQIGRMAYHAADNIISLYEGNRDRQITDGAPGHKTETIPNGISLARYGDSMDRRPSETPMVIGFIGRIVPIKDVKTFIRAMKTVANVIPKVEVWLVGPTEEDEDYFASCQSLTHNLGLSDNVKFLGFQNVPDILPQLGLLVLTSISEAQPLVLLEAFAAGVPCVATDVGACREMIEGAPGEDRALGAAGRVVGMADPSATANACIELLGDAELWTAAQAAGLRRVHAYYTEQQMFERYRGIYAGTGTADVGSNGRGDSA